MQSADGVEITAEFFLNKLKTEREDVQIRGAELHQELKKVLMIVSSLIKLIYFEFLSCLHKKPYTTIIFIQLLSNYTFLISFNIPITQAHQKVTWT